MVEPLKHSFDKPWLKRTPMKMVLSACLLFSVLAQAENLPDPTQPSGSQGYQDAGDGGNVGLPKLQSVLISPTAKGRRLAIINGQTLRIGEKLGGAVLIRISETEVALRNGQNVQVVKLFPDGEKRATKVEPSGEPQAKAKVRAKRKKHKKTKAN